MSTVHRTPLAALAGVAVLQTCLAAQTPATARTPEQLFAKDVHARANLTCGSCHTDPGPPAAIARVAIGPLCARCHSDQVYMQGFAKEGAKPRTDQFDLYQTTTHGRRMAKGETRVATCSDCHRSHGVLPVTDPESTVAPRNVAATCGSCHSDPARMKPFGHYGDPPDAWRKSVHAAALEHDASAPTCSSCHSPHGLMREGAASLQMVCADCHVREADLYLKSPHKKAFDAMHQPGCLTCHSNHEIVAPSAALIATEPPGICGACHTDAVKGLETIKLVGQGLRTLSEQIDSARQMLDRAEVAGMLVDDGRIDLHEAVEQQILGRVAFHGFEAAPVTDLVTRGASAAVRARQAGSDALSELQARRRGLAVATLLILGFLVTLGLKIRRLPKHDDD